MFWPEEIRRNQKGKEIKKEQPMKQEKMRQAKCSQGWVQKIFQENGNDKQCQALLISNVRAEEKSSDLAKCRSPFSLTTPLGMN